VKENAGVSDCNEIYSSHIHVHKELTFCDKKALIFMDPSAAFFQAVPFRQAVVREPPVYTGILLDIFWRFSRVFSLCRSRGGRNIE
jgi:hypothetical protein